MTTIKKDHFLDFCFQWNKLNQSQDKGDQSEARVSRATNFSLDLLQRKDSN